MRLNDVYGSDRSDVKYDKMGAVYRITKWYEDVYDLNDDRLRAIDKVLSFHDITGDNPDMMERKLLMLSPPDLSKVYRSIKSIMER